MKNIFKQLSSVFVLMLMSATVTAQSINIPDTLDGWDQSWVASLNGSQAAYNNWSQGGVSSISGTGSSILTLKYRQGLFSYGFRTNLKYGQSNIKGQGVRKTDDVIELINRFNYMFSEGSNWSGYGNINFRTQFDKGYDYSTEDGVPDVLISDFLAPAYIMEGVGLAFDPGSGLTFEAGLALKQTIVNDDSLKSLYNVAQDKNIRGEGGLTTGINFEKEVFENILYTSSLETFTNFLIPVSETDVKWGNELVGQINSLVSASFQFELRYDNDFSSEVQLKQVLSAGISVNLY
ncbi:DUF3078 domain-containing protein [Gracilimonas tropica]|uniref:DUF3078 domain-containing protein n=1 Tax=Gracilimonas tropica TaxID=454600 RepID=UPI0003822102|nr:DUF3078 domain-containing protein [Gracilimonas tropica]